MAGSSFRRCRPSLPPIRIATQGRNTTLATIDPCHRCRKRSTKVCGSSLRGPRRRGSMTTTSPKRSGWGASSWRRIGMRLRHKKKRPAPRRWQLGDQLPQV
jgi:hypothetical protein